MKIIDYPDRDTAAAALGDSLAASLAEHLKSHPRASLAVPGGTTPGPIFDRLGAALLDWDRVSILLTDERWVPETSTRSNAGLIRARLLQGPAAKARFIPFYKDGLSASEATEVLSKELATHFPLSLLLLGMGADMHTASLFPGADGLEEALSAQAPAVCAVFPESQPEPRITLSARVLDTAAEKHLVIYGEDKRRALQNAQSLGPKEAPISAVIQRGTVHWAP